MAFDFPANPSQNQEFTPASPTGHTYIFKSPRWVIKAANTSGGIITVDWDDITNLPPDFPPSAHTHPQSEVIDLIADLAVKAPLASPNFIGIPRAPTAVAGTADTQIASTQFVAREIASGAFTDAPSDGEQYARQDAAWSIVETFPDAPVDTKQYARQDALWSEVIPTDWATIPNKPVDFPATPHTHPQADVTNLVADLLLKAPLASPALTGIPTAPTAAVGTATTQLATTEFVSTSFAAVNVPTFSTDLEMDALTPSLTELVNPQNVRFLVGGQLSTLTTTVKTALIPAINEVDAETTQLAADITQITADMVALNAEVDLLEQGHEFTGTFKADTGTIVWTAASGGTGGLPAPADPGNKGWYLICDGSGAVPPVGAPAGDYTVGDWLISNGAAWVKLDFSLASAAASNIVLAPAVAGAVNVQDALVAIDADVTAIETVNTAQDAAIAGKEGTIAPGLTTDYWRGDKTWVPLPAGVDVSTKADITYVDAENDAQDAANALAYEPIITAGVAGQYWDGTKAWVPMPAATPAEPPIAPGLTTDYWRGDKTWVPLPVAPAAEPPIAAGLVTDYWNGLKAWVPFPAIEPPLPAGGLATDYLNGLKVWTPFPPPAPPTIIADDPPVATTAGQLWWESDTGTLLIWYDDGTSPQWVATGAVGPAGPAGPVGMAGPPYMQVTQVEYDALNPPDPAIMYVIIG